ncbi:hypothetical protein BV22DRAFT_747146 [Leucogyrophana mollusca]|uniref:Uncharacterized protein n=1 Tax=Leucogyrophana mollusca TaxID=85980 RepID=A0ACB8B5X6_9AGAM|nr:hypothetical protein BV22DRAFT_747146 [Leucogyrophana mollusca]
MVGHMLPVSPKLATLAPPPSIRLMGTSMLMIDSSAGRPLMIKVSRGLRDILNQNSKVLVFLKTSPDQSGRSPGNSKGHTSRKGGVVHNSEPALANQLATQGRMHSQGCTEGMKKSGLEYPHKDLHSWAGVRQNRHAMFCDGASHRVERVCSWRGGVEDRKTDEHRHPQEPPAPRPAPVPISRPHWSMADPHRTCRGDKNVRSSDARRRLTVPGNWKSGWVENGGIRVNSEGNHGADPHDCVKGTSHNQPLWIRNSSTRSIEHA